MRGLQAPRPGPAFRCPCRPPLRRPRRRGSLLPSVGRRRQRGARGSPRPWASPCPRAPRAISHQGLRCPREGGGSERARHPPRVTQHDGREGPALAPGRDPHGPSAVSRVCLRSAAGPGHRRCPVNPSRVWYHARTRLPQGPGALLSALDLRPTALVVCEDLADVPSSSPAEPNRSLRVHASCLSSPLHWAGSAPRPPPAWLSAWPPGEGARQPRRQGTQRAGRREHQTPLTSHPSVLQPATYSRDVKLRVT